VKVTVINDDDDEAEFSLADLGMGNDPNNTSALLAGSSTNI